MWVGAELYVVGAEPYVVGAEPYVVGAYPHVVGAYPHVVGASGMWSEHPGCGRSIRDVVGAWRACNWTPMTVRASVLSDVQPVQPFNLSSNLHVT